MSESLYKLLSVYIQHHGIEGSTPATIKHKLKEIGLFLRFLEGCGHPMSPAGVTSFDVAGHLGDMKLRGLSANSIHTWRRALHAWFVWMVDWEIVEANPVSRIKPPRLPRVRKPFLDESAFKQLLVLCPLNTLMGSRRASMLWILATTGMRRKELHMLNLEDRGEIRVIHGKGQRERRVPFMLEVQRPVLRYLSQRNDSLECLWVSQRGSRLDYHSMGGDLYRLYKRAGLSVKDPVHIFRRTFAANAVRQGVPRQYTQAVTGWADSQMLDRYVAATEAEEGAFRDFKPFGKVHPAAAVSLPYHRRPDPAVLPLIPAPGSPVGPHLIKGHHHCGLLSRPAFSPPLALLPQPGQGCLPPFSPTGSLPGRCNPTPAQWRSGCCLQCTWPRPAPLLLRQDAGTTLPVPAAVTLLPTRKPVLAHPVGTAIGIANVSVGNGLQYDGKPGPAPSLCLANQADPDCNSIPTYVENTCGGLERGSEGEPESLQTGPAGTPV